MLVGFGLAADPTPEASWSCCPCAPFCRAGQESGSTTT